MWYIYKSKITFVRYVTKISLHEVLKVTWKESITGRRRSSAWYVIRPLLWHRTFGSMSKEFTTKSKITSVRYVDIDFIIRVKWTFMWDACTAKTKLCPARSVESSSIRGLLSTMQGVRGRLQGQDQNGLKCRKTHEDHALLELRSSQKSTGRRLK